MSQSAMLAFLLILGLMLLLDLLWLAVSDKLLKKSPRWRRFNAIFLILQGLAFAWLIGGRVTGLRWELPVPVMSSLYLWHLLFLPALNIIGLLVLPVLLIIALTKLLRRGKMPAQTPPDPETTQTRRQFLLTTATVAPPLINLALAGFSLRQIKEFRVREITLALPGLPPALSGITIAHVSDLHVGPFTSGRVIRQVAERVNSLRADLILFTGDLINSKLSELSQGIDFVRLLEARSGVAMIEGNHDLFEGRAAFEDPVRAAGLRLLINQTETLRIRDWPVQLLGLRWGGRGANSRAGGGAAIRDSMDELLHLRETDGAFPILLAHHPHAFDVAAQAGLPLTLAGHTHGGQLMLSPQTGAGPLIFRYWSGLYTRDRSQLIVSNGVGNWFPLRTQAPAEIIRLTLRRAD